MAKERLGKFKPSSTGDPPKADLLSSKYLHHLLEQREINLYMTLGTKMKKAGKEGVFTEWMYEQSDLVQAAARAYAKRLVSEQFAQGIESADSSLRSVLGQLYHLYLLDVVEKDLGWFVLSGLLPADVGKGVSEAARGLCKELAPNCLALAEAFGVTDSMMAAPIARDWIGYNEYDNQGEVRKM